MQNNQTDTKQYLARIGKLQDVMRTSGLTAIVLESGPAMKYLTGVRWGNSERTFSAVIPASGDPSYVLPAFEEMRARELIKVGSDIRAWQEDESPFHLVAEILQKTGSPAKIGMDDSVRFFVFDGIRKEAPHFTYVSAEAVLVKAGVDLTPVASRHG